METYRPTSPEFPRDSKVPGAAAAWARYDKALKEYNASKTARANKALNSEKDAPALVAAYKAKNSQQDIANKKSKQRQVAQKVAAKKAATKDFMSVEDVKKAKKAGTYKDWTSKYGKNN